LDADDRQKPVTVYRIPDVREIWNLLTRQEFACRTDISLGQEGEGLIFEMEEALERVASSLDADEHLLDFESASKK
jgi:hypothetical protein